MKTTINADGPVDYVLDLVAPADDFQPRVEAALKKQRNRVQLRGFRPGKAPMDLVKKLYGESVRNELAQQAIQDAFDADVRRNPTYRLVGYPIITALAFDEHGGFTAALRFGVRPELKVTGLSNEPLIRLAYTVDDAQIDDELETVRRRNAVVEDAPEGAVLADDSVAVVDIVALDDAGQPMASETEKGVRIPLDEPRVHQVLKDALLGKKAGDTFTVELPHDESHDGHEAGHTHPFSVTVARVENRTLPELNDAFVQRFTKGRTESLDALRDEMRDSLDKQWTQRRRDYLEAQVMERLMEANDVPVPDSAVELYLDSMTEQVVREQFDGKLPDDFPHDAFRAQNRTEAERQARWMLLRDQLILDHQLEVEDEDFDAYFAKEAGNDIDPRMLRSLYERQEGAMGMLEQRLLSEKLFDRLTDDAAYEDKTFEQIQGELAAMDNAGGMDVVDEAPKAKPKKAAKKKAEPAADDAPAADAPKGWFDLTVAKNGEFQFTLKAGNGEEILRSETYKTRASAEKGIASVQKNSQDDGRFARETAKNGQFYFVLKAGNGQVIGTSEMYTSEAGRDNGIASVMRNGVTETIKDKTA